MSQPHNKKKINTFKLSSSFNQLYSSKKQQTEQFIKDISQKNRQDPLKSSKQKSRQKSQKKQSTNTSSNSLFKFNTHSQSLLSDIPIDYIKKKSQSRLQSINDGEDKAKFSLLQNQYQKKQTILKDRKQLLKKYNIDLNAVMSQQVGKQNINEHQKAVIEEEQPESVVKPSELYSGISKPSDPFLVPTIFQTPLLPCFSSQFTLNPEHLTSKKIKQGEGVWRIGKIKIKKNKGVLKIGEIQYDCEYVNGQGKCVGIRQDFMYKTKNWSGLWVCQPKDEIFQQ